MKIIFNLIGILFLSFASQAGTKDYSNYNLLKAVEFAQQENFECALDYVSKQITQYPKHADAYILKAYIYYNEFNKYGSALESINMAIPLWKKGCLYDQHDAYLLRAGIYAKMGMYQKAIPDYDTAAKMVPKDDSSTIQNILFEKANAYYVLDEYDKSDEVYKQKLKLNEANQPAMIGLIRNMLVREEYDAAIKLANTCESFYSDYDEIYRFRMQAYDKKGEADKAIDDAIIYCDISRASFCEQIKSIFKKHISYAKAEINLQIKKQQR